MTSLYGDKEMTQSKIHSSKLVTQIKSGCLLSRRLICLWASLVLMVFGAQNALASALVSWNAPISSAKYTVLKPIMLAVLADTFSNNAVNKVEFYQGGNLIGAGNLVPYGRPSFAAATLNWNPPAAGTYSLTAKATDSAGGVISSAPISITVSATNTAPTVSLLTPATNASYTLPATIRLTAEASGIEVNTPISAVEFFQNNVLIGRNTYAASSINSSGTTSTTYGIDWTPTIAGTFSLTAKATDSAGAVTTSAPITVTVKATNAAPTVSLTGPLAGSKYLAPATIPLTATAADTDGTIAKVEYYQGTTLIATSTTAPFSATWANAPAGTYSLTAKATDNKGIVTTSAANSITINATNTAPTVSLTAPLANASYTLPATVALAATANGIELNTPITKVEYYQGTTLIGSSTTSPYSANWTPTIAGTYSLTAKATDSAGGVTTSAALSITVKTATASIVYLQGDHQGTPRIATNSANKVIWRNQPLGEPFGLSAVEEDPDGDGNKFVLNLRFPGQYYDKETATHYNMQRDYDPATGRYLQSDPIGLAGGINTYAYVGGNPLSFFDPLGLAKCWSTSREAYWENKGLSELSNPSGKYSDRNVSLMLEGKSPRLIADVRTKVGAIERREIKIELHHTYIPQRSGSVVANDGWNLTEATPWGHASMDASRHVGADLVKIIRGTNSY